MNKELTMEERYELINVGDFVFFFDETTGQYTRALVLRKSDLTYELIVDLFYFIELPIEDRISVLSTEAVRLINELFVLSDKEYEQEKQLRLMFKIFTRKHFTFVFPPYFLEHIYKD